MATIESADPKVPGSKSGLDVTVTLTLKPNVSIDVDTSEDMRAPTGIDDGIKGSFVNNLFYIESIEAGVKTALAFQHHFIFPGNGTLAMKNPMFNPNGDLLVGLDYKPSPV